MRYLALLQQNLGCQPIQNSIFCGYNDLGGWVQLMDQYPSTNMKTTELWMDEWHFSQLQLLVTTFCNRYLCRFVLLTLFKSNLEDRILISLQPLSISFLSRKWWHFLRQRVIIFVKRWRLFGPGLFFHNFNYLIPWLRFLLHQLPSIYEGEPTLSGL